MALMLIKNILRKSITQHQLETPVTASRVVAFANDFLLDILPKTCLRDAHVYAFKEGVLKILTRSGSTNQYIKEFENELRNRIMEKFHSIKLIRVQFLTDRAKLDENL